MNKHLFIFFILLLLTLLSVSSFDQQQERILLVSGDISGYEEKEGSEEKEGEEAHTEVFYVERVIDGDTIKVTDTKGKKYTVRIIGINTPEVFHPTKKAECFGQESTVKAKKIIGEYVSLVSDPTQSSFDKYGRKLSYIILQDGRDFGEVMISEGFAYEYTYEAVYQKQHIYQNVQKIAQKYKKGLWATSTCFIKKNRFY